MESDEENIELHTFLGKDVPADFETAISATGFGKFNIIYLLISVPTGLAAMFVPTTMSFVSPVAQCHLELSLNQKGYLNSATYFGMASSALLWGFLSDTFGRRRILVYGHLLDTLLTVMGGLSKSYEMLISIKFLEGFIILGPMTVITTALSEFHYAKHRARAVLSFGFNMCLATVIMPILAWGMLTTPWQWNFFGTAYVLYSWNIFIFISGIPSLIAGIGQIFLPESPKFLMTAGRNEEALQVFRRMYRVNTGRPESKYPIKLLIDETAGKETHYDQGFLKKGLTQMKLVFQKPYYHRVLLVCTLKLGVMMGYHSLRLWLPQLFTSMDNYRLVNDGNDESLCSMLEFLRSSRNNSDPNSECSVSYNNHIVYINTIIVGVASFIGFLMIGTLINTLGKANCFISLCLLSASCAIGMIFSNSSLTTVILSTAVISLAGITTNILLSIAVDLYPTNLRTTAVAMNMSMGRTGAMLGNAILPLLFSYGCASPFLYVGLSIGICGLIGFLLPKTDMKALE